MTVVVVTHRAQLDVRLILTELYDRAGEQIADRYGAMFQETYRSIGDFPGIGAHRPALGADARIRLVHPYVVIYDYRVETATILRVLHGRRRITQDAVR